MPNSATISKNIPMLPNKIVIPKHGDYIFTCDMKPLVFDRFKEKDPNNYTRGNSTVEEWEVAMKYDDFVTMEGSHHSRKNCGLKIVSNVYAEWFIKNEIWKIYDNISDDDVWGTYEYLIRKKCMEDGIEYEGY